MKSITTILILLFAFTTKAGDEFCGMGNNSFNVGEVITMKVYYTTLGMYVGAGEAVFSTSIEKYNGKMVYHCIGKGSSYSFFDKFYKVRDRYETFIDTSTILPLKFIRNVDEGVTKFYDNVTFNHGAGTAVSTKGVYKINCCIQDVISSTYYARNIFLLTSRPMSFSMVDTLLAAKTWFKTIDTAVDN
jgi:hypothetical protein